MWNLYFKFPWNSEVEVKGCRRFLISLCNPDYDFHIDISDAPIFQILAVYIDFKDANSLFILIVVMGDWEGSVLSWFGVYIWIFILTWSLVFEFILAFTIGSIFQFLSQLFLSRVKKICLPWFWIVWVVLVKVKVKMSWTYTYAGVHYIC